MKTGKSVAVLDAKYRDLWEHKLGRDMLYQLRCMQQFSPTELQPSCYPCTDANAKEARIDICDPVLQSQVAQVRLRPVNLSLLELLLLEKPSVTLERRREHMRSRWRSADSNCHVPQILTLF